MPRRLHLTHRQNDPASELSANFPHNPYNPLTLDTPGYRAALA